MISEGEVLINADLDRFVNKILEKEALCVCVCLCECVEKVFDL